ncbi:MAG TPA: hypothetical protein PKK15_14270, partial [Kouleothrix sp.]|nr:hypothetical protein [Kouleothrix sp.]
MNWTSLVIGLLIGWIAEWVIDWVYWRRRASGSAELDALREQNGRLRADIEAAAGGVAQLKADLARQSANLATAQADNDKLRAELAAANGSLAQLRAELDRAGQADQGA